MISSLLNASSLLSLHDLVIGYVGPGAGLTMFGALIAVAGVLAMAMLAPLLYPIRLAQAWIRSRANSATHASDPLATPPNSSRLHRSSIKPE